MTHPLWPAAALLLLCACAPPPPAPVVDNREAGVRSLRAADEALGKALTARDIEATAAAYAPDATFVIADRAVTGPALKTAFTEMMADPNFSVQMRTTKFDVSQSTDLGYTRGTYTISFTDPKTKKILTEKGNTLTIYKKQLDGAWKIIEDFSIAGTPPTR